MIFDAADDFLPEQIPIDRAAITAGQLNFWTQSEPFDKLAGSVRVHRRTEPGPP